MAEEPAQLGTKEQDSGNPNFNQAIEYATLETTRNYDPTNVPLKYSLKSDTISKDRTSSNWVPKEQFSVLERTKSKSARDIKKYFDPSKYFQPGEDTLISLEWERAIVMPKEDSRQQGSSEPRMLNTEKEIRTKHVPRTSTGSRAPKIHLGKRSRNNKKKDAGSPRNTSQSERVSLSETSDGVRDEQEPPAMRLKRRQNYSRLEELRVSIEATENRDAQSTVRLPALSQNFQSITDQEQGAHPMKDYAQHSGMIDPIWRTLHSIEDDTFLEPPQYREGEEGSVNRLDKPLRNVEFYLERHPGIAFVFYKDYKKKPPSDFNLISSMDGVFKEPEPYKESLSLVSREIIAAVKSVESRIPGFHQMFPDFDVMENILAPYMFMFYSLPLLKTLKPGLDLTPLESYTLRYLENIILSRYGNDYRDAKDCADKGRISRRLMKYLVKPGDVLIKKGPQPRAYIATSWATEISEDKTDLRGLSDDKIDSHMKQNKAQLWKVEVWSLEFDGNFQKTPSSVQIKLSTAEEDQEVEIDSLNYFPIQYDKNDTEEKLKSRGRMFWKCRKRFFAMYEEPGYGSFSNIGERYVIDLDTYKTLHSDSLISKTHLRADIASEDMDKDNPPEGDLLLVFPPSITGYQLCQKKWVDLEVDRISDVEWNKQAFETLVASEKTKELIEALVTNQLKTDKSTDFIAGKGNGVIVLLHGGPGTGKTFTAEGVAELAEKPLFRVTCGDVGTKPEDVEKYLESVLNLGRVWDCVVLLDEADVFLEERGLADLERNALVSVFLRVLEYNVGILILTSNRVGTFDEAFKSRIHLALHYENLNGPQQRKIWQNFLNRLKILDRDNVDYEDIVGNLEELGNENMNGRQIRNTITTARELAQFKNKKFCYEHLKHVIDVGGKFEKYLKAMREGLTDDLRMREDGVR